MPTTTKKPAKPRQISVHPSQLEPLPGNRKKASQEKANELTTSILEHGVLTPLLVRPTSKKNARGPIFEVIAGRRRLKCSKIAGVEFVPVVVRELSDEQAQDLTLIENLQHEPLDPWDEARAVQKLAAAGESPEKAAKTLGVSPRWVRRRLSLLELTPAWQKALQKDEGIQAWPVTLLEVVALLLQDDQDDLLRQYSGGGTWRREVPTEQELRDEVADRTSKLKAAPWKLDDEGLVPEAGSCSACPLQSQNAPGLFEEVVPEGGVQLKDATCRSGDCWTKKLTAYRDLQLAAAKEKHGADLLGIEGAYDGRRDMKAAKGAPAVLHSWDFERSKAGEKGARPAFVVSGKGLGRVVWIKLRGGAGSSSVAKRAKAKAKKAKPGTPAELRAMKARLAERRGAWVLREIGKVVETVRWGEATSWKNAGEVTTWPEFRLTDPKLLGLVSVYRFGYFDGYGLRAKKAEAVKPSRAKIWTRVRREIVAAIADTNATARAQKLLEAVWILEVLDLGTRRPFDQAAAVAIPKTKSQEALERKLAKKPAPAKKKPARKKKAKTRRKAASTGRTNRKTRRKAAASG